MASHEQHKHPKHCKHDLHYCTDCRAVYCKKCPEIFKTYSEWSKDHRCYAWPYGAQWTYTSGAADAAGSPFYYQPVRIGDAGTTAPNTPGDSFTITCAHSDVASGANSDSKLSS